MKPATPHSGMLGVKPMTRAMGLTDLRGFVLCIELLTSRVYIGLMGWVIELLVP